MSSVEPALEVRDIVKIYGGVRALGGVSLTLDPGEVHCLAGENGSGKSTLIKIISGVERPDSGVMVLDGQTLGHTTPSGAIRAGIQVIYQDFSLFPNLTAAENIAMLSELTARRKLSSRRRIRAAAESIVAELGLNIDLDADVEHLSVADRQLIAICRALVGDARVLIMDEPTTALTHSEVQRLFAIVRRLQERGVAIMFVSHKLDEVLQIAQRVTVLRNGQVVASGLASEYTGRSIAKAMTGRDVGEERLVDDLPLDQPPLMAVDGLGREGAFEDVSFAVQSGEILGITGLLGSGRGEIAEAIFGVEPADTGTVAVNGETRRIRSISHAVRAGIGYVPEDRLTQGLFLDKSIADNMVAASLDSYRGKMLLLDRKRIARSMRDLFARLRIKAPNVQAPVRSLSGGNAQRVVIAKWLDRKPAVLMLNGPTVGVDIGSKEEIFSILRAQAAEGMGIIVISDDIPELVASCHRVLIVRAGRIVSEMAGADITLDAIQERMTA
ncbi:sugar ABC transporter ATP-binding protein [Microbacterium sp. zg.Y625]|uniref:sugar ABC transporter ATP-binding protein n=1 Tax=Microbacterium jiangjiandongii TaxID=3049071 RepID=UPI00214C07DE|nr:MULTISPECIES: sugar ABC transporter ATP-binding protein [unclassified Microbacterium]MCR2793513.1 sugar ABC transporter ATP-binding protein [Microbacterium sp. zg.Y625]WIM25867.1 sugar ABC transporter ATP-binding protein [Microbacterium sp. zg-Y625]